MSIWGLCVIPVSTGSLSYISSSMYALFIHVLCIFEQMYIFYLVLLSETQYVTQTHFELKTLLLQPSRAGIVGGIIGILATVCVCVPVHVSVCLSHLCLFRPQMLVGRTCYLSYLYFYNYVCASFTDMFMYYVHVCAWCSWRTEECIGSPGTAATDGCEQPRGYWELNPGHPEEQPMPLDTESPL